jgi:hypothetical protein
MFPAFGDKIRQNLGAFLDKHTVKTYGEHSPIRGRIGVVSRRRLFLQVIFPSSGWKQVDESEPWLGVKAGVKEMKKGLPPEPEKPAESTDTTGAAPRSRVAQYVRMSTEDQQCSIKNQSDVIRHYAEGRNMEVVETYIEMGSFHQATSGPR